MIVFMLILIALILAFAFFPHLTKHILSIGLTLAFFGILSAFIGLWAWALFLVAVALTSFLPKQQEAK